MKVDLFRPVYLPTSIEIQHATADVADIQKARQTIREASAQGWCETREQAKATSLTPIAYAVMRCFA